jgi:beta-lactamase regulating signal transducer with metallopeptidase domain
MMAPTDLWAAALPALVRASFEGALLALAVGGFCRLCPALPPSARSVLWWLVSLKLLVGLLPLPAIEVPILPADRRAAVEAPRAPTPSPADAAPALVAVDVVPTSPAAPVEIASSAPASVVPTLSRTEPSGASVEGLASPPVALGVGASVVDAVRSLARWLAPAPAWGRAALALWLGGVLLQAWALGWHGSRWRGLVRRAEPAPPPLRSLAEALASRLGLARCPALRVSAEVRVPQVGGVFRPVVLLPAGLAQALSTEELAMTLCHELSHVRRGDLLFGWVPALAERAFFFHPAAWLASREYALAREAACDQMVIDVLDAQPGEYGRLLLRLGVGAHDTRLAAAGASPTARLLMRRLIMLEHAPSPSRLRPFVAVALAALAACAPVDVVRRPTARSAALAPPPAPPAPAEGDEHDSHESWGDEAQGPPRPQADSRHRHRDRERAERAREREERAREREHDRADRERGRFEWADWSQEAWVFFDPKPGQAESLSVRGSTRDIEAARRARGAKKGALLYVRRGERSFVITDPATIEAARKALSPQVELGRKQGALGSQQNKLGVEQGALGKKQGALGAKQAALAMKLAAKEATRAAEEIRREFERERAREESSARARRDEERERSRRARDEFESEMRELARQQREIGREQAALGERQAALGREQSRLGRRQHEASLQSERELRSIVDGAISSGKALPAR